jgi:hypothetical protein
MAGTDNMGLINPNTLFEKGGFDRRLLMLHCISSTIGETLQPPLFETSKSCIGTHLLAVHLEVACTVKVLSPALLNLRAPFDTASETLGKTSTWGKSLLHCLL